MENNYPEEDELEKIKTWEHNDFPGLLDYCMSLWTFSDYATKRSGNYRFATGGWSGNESLIEALGENKVFWISCWYSSTRGGLHIFKLPKYALPKKTKKKSPEERYGGR